MLGEIVPTLFVLMLGAMALQLALPRVSAVERPYVLGSFAVHVLMTFATFYVGNVLYRGAADWNISRVYGVVIADAVRDDFWGTLPRLVLLFLRQHVVVNIAVPVEERMGSSTLSQWILAAFGDLLFLRSFVATSMAATMWSFYGKFAALLALREDFKPELRPRLAVATLLLPSVCLWTSAFHKETIAVGGLGFALLGLRGLVAGRYRDAALAVFGVLMVAMIKPYILMPMALASGAWLYLHRATVGGRTLTLRPVTLVAAGALAVAGVAFVGQVFPQFSLSSIGEEAARMQSYQANSHAGSTYQLGSADATSIVGQLEFAPRAMLTALYRPTLLDAHNPQAGLVALENTVYLLLTLGVLTRLGVRRPISLTMTTPNLAFCLVFFAVLAVGVGLVSNNFGTLSRYRAPLMPFFAAWLLVLQAAPAGAVASGWTPALVGGAVAVPTPTRRAPAPA